MSDQHPCLTHCGRPADGYFLCRWCADELHHALGGVPWLLRQLRINETRAARYSDANGANDPTAVHALPYDPGAADVRDALTTAVTTWTRELETVTGGRCEADTAETAAMWLREQLSPMRTHPAAGELHLDLVSVIRRSYRVIDRPQAAIFVGPCGAVTEAGTCHEDLYARADPAGHARLDPRQATVRCRCGAEWDAEKRREWLLDELRGTLATAREIASAAGWLFGRTLSVKTIRTWASRGQIASHHPPGGGPARYPIGEVVDQMATTATRAKPP